MKSQIPFTTGLLVGIGETRAERLATLAAIASSHEEFGHVQEVIIQNFLPKPRTAMAHEPAASDEEFHWTIAVARLVLPDSIHLQAPPNLSVDPTRLLDFGIDDFGGISPVTADHVNPERAWPALSVLGSECDARGFNLEPRLTVYPEFIGPKSGFLDEKVRPYVLAHADSTFLARNDVWASGTDVTPPSPPTTRSRTTAVSSLLARYEPGYAVRPRGTDDAFSRPRRATSTPWSSGPTACGATSSATASPSSSTATSTTPTSARSSADSAPSPRDRCRSTCEATPTS